MKKFAKCVFAASLIFIVVTLSACMPSMSFLRDGRKAYTHDLIEANRNSELQITSDNIFFYIENLPQFSYSSESEFMTQTSRVVAEYTFHNPTESPITETLFLPVGDIPKYGVIDKNSQTKIYPDDLSKYSITVDNSTVVPTLRHFDYHAINNNEFLSQYYSDSKINPETVVTKYVFSISGAPAHKGVYVGFPWTHISLSHYFMCEGYEYNNFYTYQNRVYLLIDANTSYNISLYIIGESIDTSSWDIPVFETEKTNDVYNTVSANVVLDSTESITLKDLMLKERPQNSKISEMDWYNAATQKLSTHNPTYLDVTDLLSAYLEYQITVPANSSVTNTITAPLYPVIDSTCNPYVYNYTFLLNESLDFDASARTIYLYTPYHIINERNIYNSVEYEKTEYGYALTSTNYYEEISFTLCSEPDTTTDFEITSKQSGKNFIITIFALIGFAIIVSKSLSLIVALISLIANKVITNKNKNQNK